jgi:transposase
MNTPQPPILSPDTQALLTEFNASGESAARFARSRGVAMRKLRYALSRRAGPRPRSRSKAITRPDLVPVQIIEPTPATGTAPLELLLAGGHRVRISADFDAELLRRVVGALS